MRFMQSRAWAALPVLGLGLAACGPTAGPADDGAGDGADAPAAPPAASGDFATDTHSFEQVADGVYFARYTVPAFNSNSLVIVGDEDVIVVDSHITPATARALLSSIRTVTDNPVSVVVNTHFHYDHAHGNQAFPGARIIGHAFTRQKMATAPLEEKTFQDHLARTTVGVERLQAALEAAETEEDRQQAESRLASARVQLANLKEVAPVPPNITLDERIVLYRGEREIQLLFCGRAHTGGDVVVFLPDERLVFTGDMMLGGPSWLGDGYVDEWPATLERLKALEFDLVLPGHGPKFADRALIDHVQDFYRALWTQVADLRGQGKSVGEAAAAVDLRDFEDRLPGRRLGFDPQAVARIYERMAEIESSA